jgi:hypothetical protein
MENTQPQAKNNLLLPIGLAIVVLALIAGGYVFTHNSSTNPAAQVMTATPTTTSSGATDTTQASAYKDGTYHVVGNYTSPGGPETLDVTLILKGGVVTDSTVVADATRPESKEYQGMFVANYKSQVIGKSIDSISLTKVSGSSLAPKGFNDAVSKIKAEAKA